MWNVIRLNNFNGKEIVFDSAKTKDRAESLVRYWEKEYSKFLSQYKFYVKEWLENE